MNVGDDEEREVPPDAVLVFLSGTKEIESMMETLLRRPQFSSPQNAQWVLALHGGLPPEEQRRVFERPPPGIRKIVLATNVAETSITIDDVGFVIDTARMKEQRYDASKRLASLEDCFVSRANARQRRGRAGRVAPGVAVHLVSKHTHDKYIDSHQAPEVQRVPLEQLVLRIRAMNLPGTAASVCERLLEPPSQDAVAKAVMELVMNPLKSGVLCCASTSCIRSLLHIISLQHTRVMVLRFCACL